MKKINYKIFLLLFLGYIYFNYKSSVSSGVVDGNRLNVYIFLIGIIITSLLITINKFITLKFLERKFNIILFVFLLYILILGVIRNSDRWILSVHLFLSFFWIILYSYIYYLGKTNNKILSFIISSLEKIIYINIFIVFFSILNIKRIYQREIGVTNSIFDVLALYPLIFLIKGKKNKIIITILVALSVVLSAKRSAIIIFLLMMINSNFYKISFRKTLRKIKKLFILLPLILPIIYIKLDYIRLVLNRFSLDKLEGGSGRTSFYGTIISSLNSKDIVDLILGGGSGTTIRLLGTGAHNEWLFYINDFGIVGLFLQICLHIFLIKKIYKSRKNVKNIYLVISNVYIMIFVNCMVSGFYFVYATIYQIILIAIVDVKLGRENEKNRRSYIS